MPNPQTTVQLYRIRTTLGVYRHHELRILFTVEGERISFNSFTPENSTVIGAAKHHPFKLKLTLTQGTTGATSKYRHIHKLSFNPDTERPPFFDHFDVEVLDQISVPKGSGTVNQDEAIDGTGGDD
jgi:hypothetical protein